MVRAPKKSSRKNDINTLNFTAHDHVQALNAFFALGMYLVFLLLFGSLVDYISDASKILYGYATPVFASMLTILLMKFVINTNNYPEFLGFRPISKKWFMLSTCVGLILFVIVQGTFILLSQSGFDMHTAPGALQTEIKSSPLSAIILSLLICLGAPFGEEVLFRGIMRQSLFNWVKNVNISNAYFISVALPTIIFASLHMQSTSSNVYNIFLLCSISLLAIVSSWFAFKTKSIYPSICLHIAYNVCTVLAVLFF